MGKNNLISIFSEATAILFFLKNVTDMRIFQCTYSVLTGHAKTTVKNSPSSEKLDSFATKCRTNKRESQ